MQWGRMPPLTDTYIYGQLLRAFERRDEQFELQWTRKAVEEMCRDLPISNITPQFTRVINKAMQGFLSHGGRINQVEQDAEGGRENAYFYEARIKIDGVEVYVKMVILEEDQEDSPVCVVSCHHGWSWRHEQPRTIADSPIPMALRRVWGTRRRTERIRPHRYAEARREGSRVQSRRPRSATVQGVWRVHPHGRGCGTDHRRIPWPPVSADTKPDSISAKGVGPATD